MGQFNMHLAPGFEKDLGKFMRARGIKTKSEAIRIAVAEALSNATQKARAANFEGWLGLGNKAPRSRKPRFVTDADLWG